MTTDPTEKRRKEMVAQINRNPVQRDILEEHYGKGNVWDTKEVTAEFNIEGFMAPLCVATRRADGVRGSIYFQDHPRFYYNFNPA